jgi:hypothetical protein
LEASLNIKRDRKSNQSPPNKKVQISRQLPQHQGVSLPPTPPPRENILSHINSALHEFLVDFQKRNPNASTAECDQRLIVEARRLYATVRPLPPPEKIDDPIIDEAWISRWRQGRRILGSPLALTYSGVQSYNLPIPNTERPSSEESEPRSPVSTVSSLDNMSVELAPMKANGLPLPAESPERMKRKIEELKKDIEKREQRILHEERKKDASLRRLEKLEKALGQ